MKNKRILKIVVLILIVIFSSIAGVYAERIIASSKVTYNNSTSGLASNNVQGAVDELYNIYDKYVPKPVFSTYLKSLAASDTVVADDGTVDHNMRYTGKSPNNYITFEGELWRVIGVFNNIDNGSGLKETRIKIIRASSLGNKPWHTTLDGTWKSASLNSELQALSYASSSKIENAVWYLGDYPGSYDYTSLQAYEKERGTRVAAANDLTWTGKVGLMYPSDYGFASSACKDGAKVLSQYNATDIDCKGTDWLFLGSYEWLISPDAGGSGFARLVSFNGEVPHNMGTYGVFAVRPVVYLKSSVVCKNCMASNAGAKNNPFIIG